MRSEVFLRSSAAGTTVWSEEIIWLRLDADPPTATVAASFSKRRREDTQVLHPELARQLREWLATKRWLRSGDPLFPVSGHVPGSMQRKTHKMMRLDLEAARAQWIAEAPTPKEQSKRERGGVRSAGVA